MSSFPLTPPGNRNVRAAAQGEVGCTFAARAARAIPGRARKVLAWAGPGGHIEGRPTHPL